MSLTNNPEKTKKPAAFIVLFGSIVILLTRIYDSERKDV
jgi:hypothetical protein